MECVWGDLIKSHDTQDSKSSQDDHIFVIFNCYFSCSHVSKKVILNFVRLFFENKPKADKTNYLIN